MNKITIELARFEHVKGYGHYGPRPYTQDSDTTLDAVMEWANDPANAGRTVYRHVLRTTEEPQQVIRYFYASENNLPQEQCASLFSVKAMGKGESNPIETENALVEKMTDGVGAMVSRAPYCDEVYYLDIYWQ